MQNYEIFLTNYYVICSLLDAGFTIKDIAREINKALNTQITYRQLRYLIHRVKTKTIHREYNSIIILDTFSDGWDINSITYSVEFHGFLITYTSASSLINPKCIIKPNNLINLYSKTSVLYAKRILKLYHMPDTVLLEQHKETYPNARGIDLNTVIDKIHTNLNDEFNAALLKLRETYVNFIAAGITARVK